MWLPSFISLAAGTSETCRITWGMLILMNRANRNRKIELNNRKVQVPGSINLLTLNSG